MRLTAHTERILSNEAERLWKGTHECRKLQGLKRPARDWPRIRRAVLRPVARCLRQRLRYLQYLRRHLGLEEPGDGVE